MARPYFFALSTCPSRTRCPSVLHFISSSVCVRKNPFYFSKFVHNLSLSLCSNFCTNKTLIYGKKICTNFCTNFFSNFYTNFCTNSCTNCVCTYKNFILQHCFSLCRSWRLPQQDRANDGWRQHDHRRAVARPHLGHLPRRLRLAAPHRDRGVRHQEEEQGVAKFRSKLSRVSATVQLAGSANATASTTATPATTISDKNVPQASASNPVRGAEMDQQCLPQSARPTLEHRLRLVHRARQL